MDEIWDIYDIDHSGTLDKDELGQFVKEYMPEILNNYNFSESAFNRLFEEFDTDNTGRVDKEEMIQFIHKMASEIKKEGEMTFQEST